MDIRKKAGRLVWFVALSEYIPTSRVYGIVIIIKAQFCKTMSKLVYIRYTRYARINVLYWYQHDIQP